MQPTGGYGIHYFHIQQFYARSTPHRGAKLLIHPAVRSRILHNPHPVHLPGFLLTQERRKALRQQYSLLHSTAKSQQLLQHPQSHHLFHPETLHDLQLHLQEGEVTQARLYWNTSHNHNKVANMARNSGEGLKPSGLGINFYNFIKMDEEEEKGAKPRGPSTMIEEEAMEIFMSAKEFLDSPEALTEAKVAQLQRPLAPVKQRPQLPLPPLPSSINKPSNSDLKKYPSELIDTLLEENYRAQAETFVRISSRGSIKLDSTPISTPPVSPFVQGSNADTPTRPRVNKLGTPLSILNRSQSTPGKVFVESFLVDSGKRTYSISSPAPKSPSTFGHRIYQVPASGNPFIAKRRIRKQYDTTLNRGPFYFSNSERLAIETLVNEKEYNCKVHQNCTDCRNAEFTYLENKTMPTSIPPEERQKIINNNRSLRNIKNELENLAENNAISDEIFDTIMRALPSESSLNNASRSNIASTSPSSPTPIAAFSQMNLNNTAPPPSYNTTGTPGLPPRRDNKPAEPELTRATALYRYAEAGDCNFEVGDDISVTKYMNAEWWYGTNLRTGQVGVFPVTYVQAQAKYNAGNPNPDGVYRNEKANAYQPQQPLYQPAQPSPGPSNPYNSSVPPMAIAQQPTEQKQPGKGGEMGKKFGKKLGNAAIFGAGATIGGNIVNSIF
ncbi:hypothetical protein B7494_g5385 [Chlorociboria aeruginascens]|nr:hypothetical protein B7494_g5385 [Chlorociboria aeruginascens]